MSKRAIRGCVTVNHSDFAFYCLQISSPSGSQADRKGWWRSSASDKDTSPLLQAVTASLQPGADVPDDASQEDTMSSMSLGDIPIPGHTPGPPSAQGSADEAWGQDTLDAPDELQFNLSSNFSSRLPTVVEHMEEGMSRPQSLADLSKAGWTVDSVLSKCSSRANISRLARINSFPELATMPEMTISSASSPPSAFPEYPSQQQLADLGTRMSAAFSGLSGTAMPSPSTSKPASSLNPNAVSFQPSKLQSGTEQAVRLYSTAQAPDQPPQKSTIGVSPSNAEPSRQPLSEVVMGLGPPDDDTNTKPDVLTDGVEDGYGDQAGASGDASAFKPPIVGDVSNGERADKAVARRLMLKRRAPSFNKSKSCNDLVAAEPKSPSRSPFAPLSHLAQ